MTATISIEEMIAQEFDRFYKEVNLKDIQLSEELKSLLSILEEDSLTASTSQYSTEWEEAYEEGRDSGYEDGYEMGYDSGHARGYDSGHDRAYEEGYENAVEELEKEE